MSVIMLVIISLILTSNYFIFLMKIYSGLKNLKKQAVKIPDEFVSVIIPFRNEADNIIRCLKGIENQNYPQINYEVIFVDDNSTDNTSDIINLNKLNENIKVIKVPDNYSERAHKKRAIRYALENSKGEIIVTTDADCIHDPEWLRSLLKYYDNDTAFISGPVSFEESKSIFGKLQKLEFAGLIITGAGLIGADKPVICNAANLSYRKKVFYEVKGYENKMNLTSGDDEFLMQKISADTDYKIKFAIDTEAIVITSPKKSISEFHQQRKRWASKGLFYSDKIFIIKLILIYFFYLLIPFSFLYGIFVDNYGFFVTIFIFLTKLFIEYLVLKRGMEIIFNKIEMNLFFLAQFLHIPYIIIEGISGSFGNYSWKGRKVKR